MSFGKRVAVLTRLQCDGLLRPAWRWLLALWALGLGVMVFGVSWDGQRAVFLGLPLDGFGVGGDRAATLLSLLGEFYSWCWLAVSLVYLLPRVFLPLAASRSLCHTLWLRLLPCHPRELAVARTGRLMAAAGLVGVASLVWVLAWSVYHDLPLADLLVPVLGLLAHLLLTGGLVLALGGLWQGGTGRTVGAFLALLAPVVSFLVFLVAGFRRREGSDATLPSA